MTTEAAIVIQCAACRQKNRWHISQIGQIATCQTCGRVAGSGASSRRPGLSTGIQQHASKINAH
jgi:hypothetical protein